MDTGGHIASQIIKPRTRNKNNQRKGDMQIPQQGPKKTTTNKDLPRTQWYKATVSQLKIKQQTNWLPPSKVKHVKTRERRGSSFSQLGLEPNHTGLTAQSLFFLEESCRVKRSDTQTFSNFSNYFKRVLKLQKRSSSFSK